MRFTIRNMLCLALAIYGTFEPWMMISLRQNQSTLTKLFGYGVFRGGDLCLTKDQVMKLHHKFRRMYLSRIEHEVT